MSQAVTDKLQTLLADWAVHYQRLRNYHWNVKGPLFFELHVKFEELYTDAALKVDAIAERLLARGVRPISTLAGFLEQTSLDEKVEASDASAMVARLIQDTEALIEAARETTKAADEAGDVATVNLLDGVADEQEQTLWMLRAYQG